MSTVPDRPPMVLCSVCRKHFHEPGATLEWHANAHGRATCPECRERRDRESRRSARLFRRSPSKVSTAIWLLITAAVVFGPWIWAGYTSGWGMVAFMLGMFTVPTALGLLWIKFWRKLVKLFPDLPSNTTSLARWTIGIAGVYGLGFFGKYIGTVYGARELGGWLGLVLGLVTVYRALGLTSSRADRPSLRLWRRRG